MDGASMACLEGGPTRILSLIRQSIPQLLCKMEPGRIERKPCPPSTRMTTKNVAASSFCRPVQLILGAYAQQALCCSFCPNLNSHSHTKLHIDSFSFYCTYWYVLLGRSETDWWAVRSFVVRCVALRSTEGFSRLDPLILHWRQQQRLYRGASYEVTYSRGNCVDCQHNGIAPRKYCECLYGQKPTTQA